MHFIERFYGLDRRIAQQEALRRRGPRTEEARLLAGYVRPTPLDELGDRPDVMEEHRIRHFTEWHAGELRVALAREAQAGGGPGGPAKESGTRGQGEPSEERSPARGAPGTGDKAPSAWAEAVGRVAGWLAVNGKPSTQRSELEGRLVRAAEGLGREMSEPTARRLASATLKGFLAEIG